MAKTIMAVGAHTGDAQLTCGMLLAKHAMQGDRVVIVDLTAGERGTPAGWTTPDFRKYNVECAAKFAEKIGGESIVLDTPDGELYDSKEQELALAGLMRQYQVNAVLYHWKNSMHKDHIAASRITDNAIFFASLPTFEHELPRAPITKFLYAENWEDAEGFQPYVYLDVSDGFALWEKAIEHHWFAVHSTSFPYKEYYSHLKRLRGIEGRKGYCECFMIPAEQMRIVKKLEDE